MKNGIKSKERAQKYGEVYTPEWLVKKMCNMLEEKSADDIFLITKTFLEPACGNGNFLVEIFERKLERCNSIEDGIIALKSIYGIDILKDNVNEARDRLKRMFEEKFGSNDDADQILKNNIVCGNFLTRKMINDEPIKFLEQ